MPNGYLQYGVGPHKVMVFGGWFGSSDDWAAATNAFDADAFTYVMFDYRGYGRSKELAGEYIFDEAARDALALADSLGWVRFSLIGHSMGAAAMQNLLLTAPERIAAMASVIGVPACGSGAARIHHQLLHRQPPAQGLVGGGGAQVARAFHARGLQRLPERMGPQGFFRRGGR
ncbi:MAG: alpha/beta hydrolase [Candidatus Protistobacter heckmanni]|nr:alpha/beta hydrolase [Candidatus Protistobacter heckmanni]